MELKRKRAANFTPPETMLLCDLIVKYKNVIENKKTDGVSVQEKALAWAKLTREFNSTTKGPARTTENLKQAMLNLKKRVKKDHSNEKMMIPVTNDAPSTSYNSDINEENLVHIIEEFGTDWNVVSKNAGASEDDCKSTFEVLVKAAKKDNTNMKKHIMGTGGGPPENSEDPILERVKGIMGPEIDGFHTKYDGDSILGEDFIEHEKKDKMSEIEEQQPGQKKKFFDCDRRNLKTKKDKSLVTTTEKVKKTSAAEKFSNLADSKLELVSLQKQYYRLKIMNEQAQAEHNKTVHEMELQILKKKLDSLSK